jgi:hypothetical protein
MNSQIPRDSEDFYLLSYNAESQPMFRWNLSSSQGLKNTPSRALLAACFMLVPCLAYASSFKMEATYSSETLVGFHSLHNRNCEKTESCLLILFSFLWVRFELFTTVKIRIVLF